MFDLFDALESFSNEFKAELAKQKQPINSNKNSNENPSERGKASNSYSRADINRLKELSRLRKHPSMAEQREKSKDGVYRTLVDNELEVEYKKEKYSPEKKTYKEVQAENVELEVLGPIEAGEIGKFDLAADLRDRQKARQAFVHSVIFDRRNRRI